MEPSLMLFFRPFRIVISRIAVDHADLGRLCSESRHSAARPQSSSRQNWFVTNLPMLALSENGGLRPS
jgi:hypothetical protein